MFTPRKLLLILVEITVVAMLAVVAVALVQLYWLAPIGIVGASMEDTLYDGDTVYINKAAANNVSRGDIVVTYIPEGYRKYEVDWWKYTGENDDTELCPASRTKTFDDFVACMPFVGKPQVDDTEGKSQRVTNNGYYLVIKRVVAVPGDLVEIREGVLYVRGEREERAGLRKYSEDYSHTLQDGEYYVLGDNRSNSTDSHSYGPIRGSWIYGKVILASSRGKLKTTF